MENFIRQQQTELDELLTKAGENYYQDNKNKPNFYFDITESCKEQWLLSGKEKRDLCYDRPSIGFTYSLWYQAKRVNTFLKYFLTQLNKENNDEIYLFDLGAGAGAIQMAVGLVYVAMKNAGIKTPKIALANIDTSPFMLDYNEKYLWPLFLKRYPCCNEIEVSYQINSWVSPLEARNGNIWIVASYLFDNSESKMDVGADFEELVSQFQPNKILLTTSYNKRDYLNGVYEKLSNKYNKTFEEQYGQMFSGYLQKLNQFRQNLNNEVIQKLEIQTYNSPFRNQAKWDIDSLSGIVLSKKQPELGLLFDSLSLFNPPFKRTQVELNKKQGEAAIYKSRATKIIGPAGCGKSVVITERIKNLIKEAQYDPSLKILLTTFNKDLVKCLGDWLRAILDKAKVKRTFTGSHESWFCFQGNSSPSLYIYHFDILPTRIGKLKGDVRRGLFPGTDEEFHYHLMKKSLNLYSTDPHFYEIQEFVSPKFLLEEYDRIIYGYNIKSIEEYQTTIRRGRGVPKFQHQSKKKELIFRIINTYLSFLIEKGHESFTTMRLRFLKQLEENGVDETDKFTHLFIDELQDCTFSDYQIFYKLLKKNHQKNIAFAGDLAQSIQLGAALYIPKSQDASMGNWENHFLEGSYRLPFRISEGICELSKQINTRYGKREDVEVSIITPYRGAPPGARIIIVYADTLLQMAGKVKDIYNDYSCFLLRKEPFPVTVYEQDYDLVKALQLLGVRTENEHILKSKGMEKSIVFWSTRTTIDSENEVYEFIYTILTRTCCLLVIGLSKNTLPVYHKIISTFRNDRIILGMQRRQRTFMASAKQYR